MPQSRLNFNQFNLIIQSMEYHCAAHCHIPILSIPNRSSKLNVLVTRQRNSEWVWHKFSIHYAFQDHYHFYLRLYAWIRNPRLRHQTLTGSSDPSSHPPTVWPRPQAQGHCHCPHRAPDSPPSSWCPADPAGPRGEGEGGVLRPSQDRL